MDIILEKIEIPYKLFETIFQASNNEVKEQLKDAKEKELEKIKHKRKVISRNRELKTFQIQQKIKDAVLELKEESKTINPHSVSKKANVSIITVRKYQELIK